mmetsp:Transcript_19914/g.79384  ORF Transcript_19914/g.79384 Transcript_19914/m.79384 type:complete len:328 (+) Transcript_19914:956-1939(+)
MSQEGTGTPRQTLRRRTESGEGTLGGYGRRPPLLEARGEEAVSQSRGTPQWGRPFLPSRGRKKSAAASSRGAQRSEAALWRGERQARRDETLRRPHRQTTTSRSTSRHGLRAERGEAELLRKVRRGGAAASSPRRRGARPRGVALPMVVAGRRAAHALYSRQRVVALVVVAVVAVVPWRRMGHAMGGHVVVRVGTTAWGRRRAPDADTTTGGCCCCKGRRRVASVFTAVTRRRRRSSGSAGIMIAGPHFCGRAAAVRRQEGIEEELLGVRPLLRVAHEAAQDEGPQRRRQVIRVQRRRLGGRGDVVKQRHRRAEVVELPRRVRRGHL